MIKGHVQCHCHVGDLRKILCSIEFCGSTLMFPIFLYIESLPERAAQQVSFLPRAWADKPAAHCTSRPTAFRNHVSTFYVTYALSQSTKASIVIGTLRTLLRERVSRMLQKLTRF